MYNPKNLKPKMKQEQPEQIPFQLKKSKLEGYYKVKSKVQGYEKNLSLTTLWKSNLFWILFTIDLSFVILSLYLVFVKKIEIINIPILLSREDPLFISNPYYIIIFFSIPLIFDILYFFIAKGIVGKLRIVHKLLLFIKLIITVFFVIFCLEIFVLVFI